MAVVIDGASGGHRCNNIPPNACRWHHQPSSQSASYEMREVLKGNQHERSK